MSRLHLVWVGVILVFLLVICRLYYWQILKSSELSQMAFHQYFFTLELPPVRGNILSSDEAYLAANESAYLIYAEPPQIKDKPNFANQVSELLNLDKVDLVNNLLDDKRLWLPLKHKVNEVTTELLKNLQLIGLGWEKEAKRYYPEASMAAHLLGFVGSDREGKDTGYFGVEGFYNQALKGKPGYLTQEKDAMGIPILLGENRRIEAENGQTLELYLDRTVQQLIEDKLKAGITRYGAKSGMVGVIDPATGGILGMVSFPQFDPGDYSNFDNSLFINPFISYTFEPGSTFKILVMAAALNERVIDPQTKFNEDGPVKIGEYSIKTWNSQYHGEMTATQILEKSSNPGMVFIGRKLGKQKLLSYLEKYGFGKKTGIDLEGENASTLRPSNEWNEIDLATTTFGQGIAVTPIQMLKAVAALANNGDLLEPHVVKRIQDVSGKKFDIKPKKIDQVIRSTVAKTITEMMINAVDNGEAKWSKPKGYRIAGKTGTAQIPVAGHYDSDKTIASFVGFAPADEPKFVMLVLLNQPTTSPWGSETAAPLFFDIARELFIYYGLSPQG